jgi:hypothetical protein
MNLIQTGLFLTVALSMPRCARTQEILYVDQNAESPVPDGSSWCRAYPRVSDALTAVTPGSTTTIRVAGGSYLPDPGALADPRDATFQLVSGVTIEGSYAGCGAPRPDERDAIGHPTILSGDLHGDDLSTGNKDDNVYHVLTADHLEEPIVLDGLTITAGNASDLSGRAFGGGIYIEGGVTTLRNCRFAGNAGDAGGAVANIMGSTTATNCTFSGNAAANDGGAAFNDLSVLTLLNCTLVGNTARTGAGIRNYTGVMLELSNCILWGNVASGSTSEAAQIENTASSTTVDYSCIQDWTGTFGGIGNTGADPLFVDADGEDDLYGTVDDNLRLREESPCVDVGTPQGAPSTDLDGFARPCGDGVDMGAYENGECREPGPAPLDRSLAVAWNDAAGGSGMLRAMRTRPPWDFTSPSLPIGRDSILRFAGEKIYAVSPVDDTITVVVSDTWMIERTHSLQEGSQPLDIAVVSPETAYVTRRMATHLLRLDLLTGASEEVVDLGVFADADGIPDLGTMAVHEGRLFVQVRRRNLSGPGQFAPPAYLAVIDVASGEIVDVDPATPGVQAIQLAGTAPKLKMQIVPPARRLFVNASGQLFDQGGIEVIDLDILQSLGLAVRESDGRTGADLGGFVLTDPERGFLVYTTDLVLSSHLESFTVTGGADPEPAFHTVVDYLAPTLEYNEQDDTIFFPSSGSGGNGVDVFDAGTGRRLTPGVTPTNGPPTDLLLLGNATPEFVRGDADASGDTDLSDSVSILNHLFLGEGEPQCLDAADTDDTGVVDITDAVYLLQFLFLGGPSPEDPFGACGVDRTIDTLTCESFQPCEEA